MKELIEISNFPASVKVNFEELKNHLATELKKYDVVVTQDTVKDAKALATQLNATKKEIAKRKKEEYDRATAGANQFKDCMKELETMCEEGRQTLLAQVQKFEDETRKQCEVLLNETRRTLWDDNGVKDEFRKAGFDDLILVSNVTPKGSLTSKAYRALVDRVNADKALQDRTETRLLKLENQSYKAGLSAPLTRDHVQHFLFADDTVYEQELQRIIDAEIGRQEEAERRMREKMERERQEEERKNQEEEDRKQRMEAHKPEMKQQVEEQHEPDREPQPEAEWYPRPSKSKRQPITVTCTFETSISSGVSEDEVKAELRRVLENAGIKTLASISISKREKAA